MDIALLSRRAIVTKLKATAAVTALVPAGSIYGETVPDDRTFPFIRVYVPDVQPFVQGCNANGRQAEATVHVHTKGESMDEAVTIGEKIDAALSGITVPLEGGGKASLGFVNGGCVSDAQLPDHWHWFGTYNAA